MCSYYTVSLSCALVAQNKCQTLNILCAFFAGKVIDENCLSLSDAEKCRSLTLNASTILTKKMSMYSMSGDKVFHKGVKVVSSAPSVTSRSQVAILELVIFR